ncbi:hypothetical protein E3P86_03857 [Wallemia ichthyophaga]|uniref:Arginine N-methyltransferase 2 n=1 Tax=Wallemia ichthyophaga TaxID=245174 RepID=A0A4T0IMU4_WALIC|nr:hypothetical protein E3P86_03857 [Wallemia ichthyophaga]
MSDDEIFHNAGMAVLHCSAIEDTESLKLLIDKGAPIFYQDPSSGYTSLHLAADKQSLRLVRYLLNQGATWNAIDHAGFTPADIALSYGNTPIYEEIVAEGVRAEFILNLLGEKAEKGDSGDDDDDNGDDDDSNDPASNLNAFLSSQLTYEYDSDGNERVVDSAGDPVMMAWETPIMKASVRALCDNHPDTQDSLSILNVGFGLGIIDTEFQKYSPTNHTIIEAHPHVLQHMRETGWYDKPGVTVCEGTWQDHVDSIGQFDVIYFDTFSEHYRDLKAFFEHIPDLVESPNSRFSFFHGLGATNGVFYDVYTRIADMHLEQIGLSAQWEDVPVPELSAVWKGVRRSYWNLPVYKLPIARMNIF